MVNEKISSSFRDPSGFLFNRNGRLYRQINSSYKENYDFFMSSGLYQALAKAEILVSHQEVDIEAASPGTVYKVIQPKKISFISYPYEWCFSQLKEAALITLKIQKIALDFGMSLKDSSVYNIQFQGPRPILIDTLSFEKYQKDKPWVAYRQFCQHFLAPLALASLRDIRLQQLLRVFIDGIPIDLASALLPFNSRFKFPLLSHIHLHAKTQKDFADKTVNKSGYKMSQISLRGLIDNLESAVSSLKCKQVGSEWGKYYEETNYSSQSFAHKKEIVTRFLDKTNPRCVWDLGANLGIFSRIASSRGIETVAFDNDVDAVEKSYLKCRRDNEAQFLPLVVDLTNPSSSIGWQNQERMSLMERGPVDVVFALALVHHLAISNNLPLVNIAEFFHKLCKFLIIEFVPKKDSKVQKLLATREDIFPHYTQQDFENEFKKLFNIRDSLRVRDSQRTMYLMQKK
jgi:ribosomal protein L11 methylase PrmA